MSKQSFSSTKLWSDTKKEAKILAARQGMSLVNFFDLLVDAEKMRLDYLDALIQKHPETPRAGGGEGTA